ncbi:MAG: hypothetical protein LQ342_006554 [Letrouitia transgressa]|nr:MAG: hypothetical protein LQ342_006554 [Letrouitia transgressa]
MNWLTKLLWFQKIDSWNTYNDQKQISQYDATFRYWQWTVDFLFQRAAAKFHTNSTQATVSVLQSLLAKRRNTLLCRMVHQNMVPYRPDVHCSHVGKTGGGYCGDDKDYVKTVTEAFFHNAPYIPFGHG